MKKVENKQLQQTQVMLFKELKERNWLGVEIIRDYDELKRKFDILLEENKALKARIRELKSKSVAAQ